MSGGSPSQPLSQERALLVEQSTLLATLEFDVDGVLIAFTGPGAKELGLRESLCGQRLTEGLLSWGLPLCAALEQALGAHRRATMCPLLSIDARLEVYPAAARGGAIALVHHAAAIRAFEGAAHLTDLGRWTRAALHTLNNALLGIMGYAELGLKTEDSSRRIKALEQIVQGGKGLRDRLRILLEHGRAHASEDRLQTCSASEAIGSALALVTATGARVEPLTQPDTRSLPPIAAPRAIVAQALANLIENALDAVSADPSRVTISAAESAGGVAFLIEDDGPGMNEGMRRRAFEPFLTTKSNRPSVLGGTGLGLPLARRMSERVGGSVDLRPRDTGGTLASAWFPCASEA